MSLLVNQCVVINNKTIYAQKGGEMNMWKKIQIIYVVIDYRSENL